MADRSVARALHCAFVRSPHASARVPAIDCADALRSPGIVAVLTGGDMAAEGIGPMLSLWPVRGADGRVMAEPPRFALARGRVRHVGEAVAVVIAETPEAAIDAAERVHIDYEALPAVVSARAALARGSTQVHDVAPHGVGDLLAALYLAHRLDRVKAPQALERSVSATLALIDQAAAEGADELPLAAGQDAFLAPTSGVTLTRLDEPSR